MENTNKTLHDVLIAVVKLSKRETDQNQRLGILKSIEVLRSFINCEDIAESISKEPEPKYLIKDIEMPVRLRNSLERLNFNYLEEVTKLSEKELSYYRNVGRKQIYDLKIILEKYNLKFKNN
jgi:DNA-directed RNA polymerase alpha subunit